MTVRDGGVAASSSRNGATRRGTVHLDEFHRVLEIYTEALAGSAVPIDPGREAPADLGLFDPDLPSSDGCSIYLPESVDWSEESELNLWFFKLAILFQLCPYETGTVRFDRAALQLLAEPQGVQLEPSFAPPSTPRRGSASSPLDDFFAGFEEPLLAERLFALFEAERFERHLRSRYRGARAPLDLLRREALARRPVWRDPPPQRRALEWLVRRLLGADDEAKLTADLGVEEVAALTPVIALLRRRCDSRGLDPSLSVERSALDVVFCYSKVADLRAEPLSDDEPRDPVPGSRSCVLEASDPRHVVIPYHGLLRAGAIQRRIVLLENAARERADALLASAQDDKDQPSNRLAQLPSVLIADAQGLLGLLDANLDRDAEPDVDSDDKAREPMQSGKATVGVASGPSGDLSASEGSETSCNGPRGDSFDDERASDQGRNRKAADELEDRSRFGALPGRPGGSVAPSVYRYDEWDWQAASYRPRWCSLREIALDSSGGEFVEQALAEHGAKLLAIKRQLELLRPSLFRRVRRLIDGEGLDLDRVVETLVDRRAGLQPADDVYVRRQRQERDVAAVFLLDMSASTDSAIPTGLSSPRESVDLPEAEEPPDDADRPVMGYRYDFVDILAGVEPFGTAPPSSAAAPTRRVIEVEKEALALMAEALDSLGDQYAIYGFSGYGRTQVDFFVAKEFDQVYDQQARARVGAIAPKQSTRMGPAIRHSIAKLEARDARVKVLLVLSDGYPQDCDYGEERGNPTYGIRDTMVALREADRLGIQTFCITVDPAGHDYLRQMCPEESYLVIDDIAALPAELTKVYRGLTS